MRKHISTRNIVNVSLALLISASHIVSAMENPDAPLEKGKTLANQIRAKVNRILQNFHERMNDYYARTGNPKRISIPLTTAETPEKKAELIPEEQLRTPTSETVKQDVTIPAISLEEALKKAADLGISLGRTQSKLKGQALLVWLKTQIVAKLDNTPLLVSDKKKALNYQETSSPESSPEGTKLLEWLDKIISTHDKMKGIDPAKITQAKKIHLRFAPLYDSQEALSSADIDKWLDFMMPIEEKFIKARNLKIKHLGEQSKFLINKKTNLTPGEFEKWLDQFIPVAEKIHKLADMQNKYNLSVDDAGLKQLKEGLNNETMSFKEANEWLDQKIPLQEKINEARKLDAERQLILKKKAELNDKQLLEWLDVQIAIRSAVKDANQQKTGRAHHLGLSFDPLYELEGLPGGYGSWSQYIDNWLDQQIPLQEKINEAKKLRVDRQLILKKKAELKDEQLLEWLDTQISLKEKEKEAIDLGKFISFEPGKQ